MIKKIYALCIIFAVHFSTEAMYFCTAADSTYFKELLNLIGGIHKNNYDQLEEIAIFNLGLSQSEIDHLASIEKVSLHEVEKTHPDLLTSFQRTPQGKRVPGWYAWKPVIIKQALELYPFVVYIDAGTTVLRPLDLLFKEIKKNGYFLCSCGHSPEQYPVSWGTTQRVKDYFNLDMPENRWILSQEFVMGGFLGASKDQEFYPKLLLPLYELTKKLTLFEDDGTAPQGFGCGRHDQTLISIFAYKNKLHIIRQDTTQTTPALIGDDEQFYITWDYQHVDHRTHIYNSRNHVAFPDHVSYIRYRPHYYSQVGQDKYFNEQIFKGKRNGFFIDIGAHGNKFSNTYFFEKELGWDGICFEPLQAPFEELQKTRRCICINKCVSTLDGNVDFVEFPDDLEMYSGIISSYDKEQLMRVQEHNKKDMYLTTMPSCRLDTTLDSYGIQHIDFLSIDTEGHELPIIQSIDFSKYDISAITIENNFNDQRIREHLERNGFTYKGKLIQDEIYLKTNLIDP